MPPVLKFRKTVKNKITGEDLPHGQTSNLIPRVNIMDPQAIKHALGGAVRKLFKDPSQVSAPMPVGRYGTINPAYFKKKTDTTKTGLGPVDPVYFRKKKSK